MMEGLETRLMDIPLEDITFGERYREDYGDLEGLKFSIQRRGTLSPIAVQDLGEATSPRYLLLAGGRRYTAHKEMNLPTIPARIFSGEISELDRREIEMEENYYRKDLNYKEQTSLCAEIHRLKQLIHGKKMNLPGVDSGWGLKQTAELLGSSPTSVQRDIKIAEALEAFPQLFEKCKTKADASRVLKKVEESILNQELAKKLNTHLLNGTSEEEEPTTTSDEGSTLTLSPTRKRLMTSYIGGNFLTHIKSVPDESVTLVEMDPPYAIDLTANKMGHEAGTAQGYNEVPKEYYLQLMEESLKECHRVMAPHSWLILWFAHEPWFEPIYQLAKNVGFSGSRMAGVWNKGTGQNKQPAYNLTSSFEMFFYFRKGQPAMAKQGRSNVFTYPPIPHHKKIHPTQRPVPLIMDLLTTFTWKGSTVMTPFAGSGTTIYAAHLCGMPAFGYDLSEDYRNSFTVWMAEAPLTLTEKLEEGAPNDQ